MPRRDLSASSRICNISCNTIPSSCSPPIMRDETIMDRVYRGPNILGTKRIFLFFFNLKTFESETMYSMQNQNSGGRGGSGENTPTFGAAGAGVEHMHQVCICSRYCNFTFKQC